MSSDDSSSTGDDTCRITFEAPKSHRDAAKRQLDWGELSQHLRGTLQTLAFGEEVAQQESLERALEQVRTDIDDIDADIRQLQTKRDTLRQREARLEEKLSASDSRKQQYEGKLGSLEALLYSGGHVYPEHGLVEDAAAVMQITPAEVIDDLKDRNPAIPDYAFKDLSEAEQKWDGIDDDRQSPSEQPVTHSTTENDIGAVENTAATDGGSGNTKRN